MKSKIFNIDLSDCMIRYKTYPVAFNFDNTIVGRARILTQNKVRVFVFDEYKHLLGREFELSHSHYGADNKILSGLYFVNL